MTAGLKWPPLTAPRVMISPKSTIPWTRPTTAKSEPVWALALVATYSTTTVQIAKMRISVPTSSAM